MNYSRMCGDLDIGLGNNMISNGISSQLKWLMIKLTFYSFVLSFLIYYIYIQVYKYIFGRIDIGMNYEFTVSDWIQFVISTLLTVFVAVFTASRFARRILAPLNSLTLNARRIAKGDLTARAEHGDKTLSEIYGLVNDFNVMAEKLETMSADIRTWNASIAHELRTPVTILRGRLQGIADGVFQPEPTLLQSLVKQTDGLARLIDDLRVLSLAESGHLGLHSDYIRLNKEVETVAELLRDTLKEKKISLVLKLNEVSGWYDATRIRQALLALLENARRYAVPGILMVTCTDSGDEIILSVEDEGPGIPDGKDKSIWDAFNRVDSSRSREYGGSGLGLAVVKAVIESHNGTVEWKPSELGGSAFIIHLPKNEKL